MKLRWFRRPTLAARVRRPHPWAWTASAMLGFAAATAGWVFLKEIPAARGVAVVLATAAFLAVRRALFARLALRPGPVDIASFTGHPPTKSGVRQVDLLAEFRRTLTEMSLSAPEPVPSVPSTRGVVDDVTSALDTDRGAFMNALLAIAAVLSVRHAYRVAVQVLSSTDGRCGLSVHVARLPSGRGEVEAIWTDDWDEAVQRAAHVVGAYLVPRSRLSRRAPWQAWYGIDMPTELFHQSQRAAQFIRERRYERALDALHRALKEDPQNPYLRIDLGQVQEQAGLHLDAAATYADVIAVEAWYDGRLWRRLRAILMDASTGAPPSRWSRKHNGRDALLIARYRVVTRLGAAEQLEEQWSRRPRERNTRRQADREALKIRLRAWLNSYTFLYEQRYRWRQGRPVTPQNEDPLTAYEEAPRERLIHLMQFVGRLEADALADDYRWSRGRRVPGLAINQTAVQLLRLGAVLHERQACHAVEGVDDEDWWPAVPELLDVRIGRWLYLKPSIARSWKEYYNAACIVSVALPGAGSGRDRTLLTLQAVRHLERAVSSTDSGYVSRYAQWLSTGDRDLDALRSTRAFVDFLDRYLPNQEPRVPRPARALIQLLMSLHTSRLLMSYCDRRVEFWSWYEGGQVSDEHARIELILEGPAAQLVHEYVADDRHWQTRMKLINEADRFCRRVGLPRVRDGFPAFQDDPEVLAAADDPRKLDQVDRDADSYFQSNIIDNRVRGMDDLLSTVRRRCEDLAHVEAEAETSKEFWRELGVHLRLAIGIVEQRHQVLSALPVPRIPPLSTPNDGPAATETT